MVLRIVEVGRIDNPINGNVRTSYRFCAIHGLTMNLGNGQTVQVQGLNCSESVLSLAGIARIEAEKMALMNLIFVLIDRWFKTINRFVPMFSVFVGEIERSLFYQTDLEMLQSHF